MIYPGEIADFKRLDTPTLERLEEKLLRYLEHERDPVKHSCYHDRVFVIGVILNERERLRKITARSEFRAAMEAGWKFYGITV